MKTTKNPYSIDACRICGTAPKAGAIGGICTKCMLAAGMASERDAMLTQSQNMRSGEFSNHGNRRLKPPTAEELKNEFPDLEFLEVAGMGGMGVVYKVKQKDLGRVVALKILPGEFASDPTFSARFSQEAKTLAMLNHPNVVHLYDAGQTKKYRYFIMEYIDGINLRQAIRAGDMKPEEALSIVPQICEALQFAHSEGIVHRDIKPENILIDKDGVVKVADFGLAKLVDADLNLTATQQVMGTVHYMAPEQIQQSSNVDHRADLYSLGVVFYEMLTGQLPLGKFAMPSEATTVNAELDSVVMRTLENEPSLRYQTANAIQSDLASVSIERLKSKRQLEDVGTLSTKVRRMLFIPAIVMCLLSFFDLLFSISWIVQYQDWRLLAEPWFVSVSILLPIAGLVATFRMMRGYGVGLFQFIAVLLLAKTILWESQFFMRLGNVIGIYPLNEEFESLPYKFSLYDLSIVAAIFTGLANIVVYYSRTCRDLRVAKRLSEDARLRSRMTSLTDHVQTSANRKLEVASSALLLVGCVSFVFSVWLYSPGELSSYWRVNVVGLQRLATLSGVVGVAMILSGFFMRNKMNYSFNKPVAWLALLSNYCSFMFIGSYVSMLFESLEPRGFVAPTLGGVYLVGAAVGMYSLWVLSNDSVKLLFIKRKTESGRLL
jgi:predicted Ser/Thr protein kinase